LPITDSSGVAAADRTKPVVLVLLSHYLPGYKAGGPIQSIANIVEALGEALDFRIVTCDRDMGDANSFSEVRAGQWVQVGNASVFYLPNTWMALWTLIQILIVTRIDLLYLNSFFARRYSIFVLLLRRLRLFRPKSVLLAPRGEFSEGAIRIKKWRKRTYIAFARKAGLYANVLWHASSNFEEADIHSAFCGAESIAVAGPIAARTSDAGPKLQIMTALDLPGPVGAVPNPRECLKPAGAIRLVFLSRISRKKNLDRAIALLRGVSGDVQFDIYGPIEDVAYWKACREMIAQLPPTIEVRYRGEVCHDWVHDVLSEYDALLFPTRGENYGHVIREALSAGCPVIVSDQTPWRGLEELGVGWDLPLDDTERFRSVIQMCIDMAPTSFAQWIARAHAYGARLATDPQIILQNQKLFARALGCGASWETAEAGAPR
jgi:glycosyltransferase involved in cell wall biosynthesis